MKAIESEELGKDNITDFLTVEFLFNRLCGSFIRSKINGVTRYLFRLDETIAEFLNYLDKAVGKDNYLLF
jgi:hypothetical protein